MAECSLCNQEIPGLIPGLSRPVLDSCGQPPSSLIMIRDCSMFESLVFKIYFLQYLIFLSQPMIS